MRNIAKKEQRSQDSLKVVVMYLVGIYKRDIEGKEGSNAIARALGR